MNFYALGEFTMLELAQKVMKKSSHLVPLVQDPEPYFAAKQCFIVLVPAVACHEP